MPRVRTLGRAAVLAMVLGSGLMATSGCSSPKARLDVGVKDIPTDVNIGAQATPSVPSTVVIPTPGPQPTSEPVTGS